MSLDQPAAARGWHYRFPWQTEEMADRPGSIGSAIVWMFIVSILLFWLPIAGPLIAGVVGGRKAGGVGNAVIAALLPGIVLGAVLFFCAAVLLGLPLLGFLAGAGGFVLASAHFFPLIIGAIFGVLL